MVTVSTLLARFVKTSLTEASADCTSTASLPSPVSVVIEVTDESGPVTVWVPLPLQPAVIAALGNLIVVAESVKV